MGVIEFGYYDKPGNTSTFRGNFGNANGTTFPSNTPADVRGDARLRQMCLEMERLARWVCLETTDHVFNDEKDFLQEATRLKVLYGRSEHSKFLHRNCCHHVLTVSARCA